MSTQVTNPLDNLTLLADLFTKQDATFSVKFDGENYAFSFRPDWSDEDAVIKLNTFWAACAVQCVVDFKAIMGRITFGTFWSLLESINHGGFEDRFVWLTQQVSYYLQDYRKDYDTVAGAVSLNARRGYAVAMLRYDGETTAQAIANAVAKGGHYSLFDCGDTVITFTPKA